MVSSVPSLAESTWESDDEATITSSTNSTPQSKAKQLERKRSSISEAANSTLFRKNRLSRQTSLPWGHKRSTMIGISCFFFVLPIPFLIKSCCPFAAFMLAVVFVTSFSSDYIYSGVDSLSHLLDKCLAPIAFISNFHAIYSLFGVSWAVTCLLSVKFHLMAMNHAKHNNYDSFVICHSLWHAFGVGLILLCFGVNGIHECLGV